MITVCKRCKSEEVQIAMWVTVNTGEIHDDFGSHNSLDTTWCAECEKETGDGHQGARLLEESEPEDTQ